MPHNIRVTGLLTIEDDEYDPDNEIPLTEEAYIRYSDELGLDDLRFELAD